MCIRDRTNEESEGDWSMIQASDELDNEPPLSGRDTFFPDVSEAEWDDWGWQFSNRITSLTQLARFIPVPEERRLALQQVTRNFRIGITPYYLSLFDPSDPHDPVSYTHLTLPTIYSV